MCAYVHYMWENQTRPENQKKTCFSDVVICDSINVSPV